jgi:hypothetical protein
MGVKKQQILPETTIKKQVKGKGQVRGAKPIVKSSARTQKTAECSAMKQTEALTAKKLRAQAEEYFAKFEGASVSMAGLCSYLGWSKDEWAEKRTKKEFTLVLRRIETKLQAIVENDTERSVTLTKFLLQQMSDENDTKRVEFVLRLTEGNLQENSNEK